MKSDLDKAWKEFRDKVEDLFALGVSLPLCLHVSAIHKVSDKLRAWQSEIDSDGPFKTRNQKNQAKQTKNSDTNVLSSAPGSKDCTEESARVAPKRGRGRPRKSNVKTRKLGPDVSVTTKKRAFKINIEHIRSGGENSAISLNTGSLVKGERTDCDSPAQTNDDEIIDTEYDNVVEATVEKTDSLKSIQQDAINALLALKDETLKHPGRETRKRRRTDADEPSADSVQLDPVTVVVEPHDAVTSPRGKQKRDSELDEFSQEDGASDQSEIKVEKEEISSPPVKRSVGRPRKDTNAETVPPTKKHFCDICSKGFVTMAALKRHKFIHDNGPLVCSHCDKKFFSHAGYSSHKKLHDNTAYQCPECPYMTGGKTWLEKHIIQVHRKDDPTLRCHLCHHCGASFVTPHALKRHVQSHIRTKDYACPDCDHTTHNADLLAVHRKNIHSNNDAYVCNICGATCKYRGSLLEHQRRHLSDKRYQCNECDYRCVSSTVLAKHRKKHMAPTQKCETCGKCFQTREHLKRHSVIHTGEKLYHCNQCSYKCNVPSNLHKHMKNLHNIHHISKMRRVERLQEISLQESGVIIEQDALDLGAEENMTVVQQIIDVVPEEALPHVQHEIYLDSREEDKKAAEIVEYVMQDYAHVGSDGSTHYVQQVDDTSIQNPDLGHTGTITIVPDYTSWN